jgi:hypothetical protein
VRHVRMLGLCLVAALALGAYAVSSASALEFGKCEKLETKTGNYTGPNCNKAAGEKAKPKGTGEYEWRKGSELEPVSFTGENAGSGGVLYAALEACEGGGAPEYEAIPRQTCAEDGGTREFFGTIAIECGAEHSSGQITGKNTVTKIHVTFTGCDLGGVLPCENFGSPEPERIETNELKGKLGWLNKSTKEVGVLLEPAVHHGLFAHFVCPGIDSSEHVGVGNKKEGTAWTSTGCVGPCPGTTPEEEKHGGYDGVISPITPVNVMTSTYTQEYKVENTETYPYNVPSKFEGKHIDVLENRHGGYNPETGQDGVASVVWNAAAEEITNVNTSEEPGEIKA